MILITYFNESVFDGKGLAGTVTAWPRLWSVHVLRISDWVVPEACDGPLEQQRRSRVGKAIHRVAQRCYSSGALGAIVKIDKVATIHAIVLLNVLKPRHVAHGASP